MLRHNSIRWLPIYLVLALLLAGSGRSVLADTPPFQAWHIETVDVQHNFLPYAGRFVAVDKSGRVQMAYGGGQLYYAYNDGDGWQFEVVDPRQGTGASPALALAPDDTPVIAYADSGGGMVRVARRTGGDWTSEAITETTGLRDLAVAVDPQGWVHVAYVTGSDLLYFRQSRAGWELAARRQALDAPGDFLALDSAGRTHLVVAGPLHEWLTEDGWRSEKINTWANKGISLAASPDGKVAVASLWIKHHTGGWDEEGTDFGYLTGVSPAPHADSERHLSLHTPSPEPSVTATAPAFVDPHFPRLSFAPDGAPHIVNPEGEHTYLGPTGWVSETYRPEWSYRWRETCAPAFDAAGRLKVGCLFETLQLYSSAAGQWTGEYVDEPNQQGHGVSLVVDADGEPHLAYGDLTRYARRTEQDWRTERLPIPVERSGQNSGGIPSIALEQTGQATIVRAPFLKGTSLWRQIAGGWSEELVVSDSYDRGCIRCVDLAVDKQGQPHLAYFDWEHLDVIHAWREGATWRSEVASHFNSRYPCPQYIWLRLDSDDGPHIVYDDPGAWDPPYDIAGPLQYVARVSEKWVLEDVGSTPSAQHALTLDAEGRPVIAYTGKGSLMLARRGADGWQSESLAEKGLPATLTHPALAADAAGVVHLTAYDWAAEALVYLRNRGGSWEMFLVDPQGGPESAISLDANSRPHIAYPNRETGAVQWATGVPTRIWLPQIVH